MFAAVAAGIKNGGYSNIADAVSHMASLQDRVYLPDTSRHEVYKRLYAEYVQLHSHFGDSAHPLIKNLRRLREDVLFKFQTRN
jgi:L-ribulokinase